MAETVNVYEAKTHLSALIARVESGEEITLSRNGRAVARIVPLVAHPQRREPGIWRSRVTIADDFDEFTEADEREWYSA
ncbi:MAG: type II toxin-antitoxin system Phd/YefM family antitoxin [Microbacteriaceae bacterium]